MSCTRREGRQNTLSHAHVSQCRALLTITRRGLTAQVWDVLHLCASSKSSTHNMFHRPLLDVPDPFPSFLFRTTSVYTDFTAYGTGIRRSACATPHGGLQFGRLVEPTPLTEAAQKEMCFRSAVQGQRHRRICLGCR